LAFLLAITYVLSIEMGHVRHLMLIFEKYGTNKKVQLSNLKSKWPMFKFKVKNDFK
jgi:hypothetical protein